MYVTIFYLNAALLLVLITLDAKLADSQQQRKALKEIGPESTDDFVLPSGLSLPKSIPIIQAPYHATNLQVELHAFAETSADFKLTLLVSASQHCAKCQNPHPAFTSTPDRAPRGEMLKGWFWHTCRYNFSVLLHMYFTSTYAWPCSCRPLRQASTHAP